jgi:tripartite-type tricarboxylate transporter receptor subunit TctC
MKRLLLAATFLGLGISAATAQGYPNKPVTVIVPFAAGGPTDTIGRIVADYFSRSLGQQFVVENVAGAGGTTGITRGSQAPADGYTLMIGHMGTHGAAPAQYPNLKYNPAKDFSPIGLLAGTPIAIVAKKDFPAKDLKEFVAYLKANGDKMNEGHAGVGSVSHTTCTLFSAVTGVKTGRIAYRGTGPVLNDLVSGQLDFGCDQIVNLVPQIKAGNIKAFAIATKERSPALPDVPTTAEGGLPGYEVSAWNAMFAPKDTPKDVVDKLAATLDKALDDPTVKARLLELGSIIPDKDGRTPGALQKLVESEVARWLPILKDAVAAAPDAAPAPSAVK